MVPTAIIDPSTIVLLTCDILSRFNNEEDLLDQYVYPVIVACINDLYTNNGCLLSDLTSDELTRIRLELIPAIRDVFDILATKDTIRIRVEFFHVRLAKVFVYVGESLPLSDKVLTTIRNDLKEGTYLYPKHIVDLVNQRE